MKTTKKKISDTRVDVKVVLDTADLKTARDQALTKLAANLKLQGFRKGKAPIEMVEKSIPDNDINSETIDIAIRKSIPEAFNQEKIMPIVIEQVNVSKYVPQESAEFTVTAEVLPEVKLGDYKKLKTERKPATVEKKEIDEVVDNICKAYSEKVVVKRAAKKGDEVIIDFVGKRDGEEFKGGSAKDYHLELGSGTFIPGFEEGIVGKSAGDKFDIKVTFPKDYPEKTLAGQKAVFETLLKQVNEIQAPKADDELAKKCGNFQTIDELRDDIKKNLETQKRHQNNEEYREALVNELVKASKVTAPEILINDQLRFIKEDMRRNAMSRGMELEDFIEAAGKKYQEWEDEARKVAEERVKASLVLQILSRENNIMPTEADVDAKIMELRDLYQRSKEALANLKKPEVRQDIKNRLTIDQTIDFLVAANEKPAKKETAKKKTEK